MIEKLKINIDDGHNNLIADIDTLVIKVICNKINEIVEHINKQEEKLSEHPFIKDFGTKPRFESIEKLASKEFIVDNDIEIKFKENYIKISEVEGYDFVKIGNTVYEKQKNKENYISKEELKKWIDDEYFIDEDPKGFSRAKFEKLKTHFNL